MSYFGPVTVVVDDDCATAHYVGDLVSRFLHTDDSDRDRDVFRARGVRFEEEPRDEPYGRVAVFRDLFGNSWDLVQTVAGADERP